MGRTFIPLGGGGSGIGSDDVNATKGDVLKGKTAVTSDSNDEPITGTLELTGNSGDGDVLSGKTYYNTDAKARRTGTMTNRGAVSQALNAGGSYTIPAGYHNGTGKVTANNLASQTNATAAAADILSGKTAWVNGGKITGTISTRSDNPTSAKLLAEDSKIKMIPPAGYYNGSSHYTWDTQALVAERGGLSAVKLLKNQSAFGIAGTATSDANSAAGDIRSGKTAYVNGTKLTGNLSVQSAISFSAAALSYNTIRISWQNPAKGPWQGIFIQMSTSGNPGTGGGSRVYTGAGTNLNQAGGNNYVDIGSLSANTQYYFTCTSYCDALGWGSSYNVAYRTSRANLSSLVNGSNVVYFPGCKSIEDGVELCGYYTMQPIFTTDTITYTSGGSYDRNVYWTSSDNTYIRIRYGKYSVAGDSTPEIPDSVITSLRSSYSRVQLTYYRQSGNTGTSESKPTTIEANIVSIEKKNDTINNYQRKGWWIVIKINYLIWNVVNRKPYLTTAGTSRPFTFQLLP